MSDKPQLPARTTVGLDFANLPAVMEWAKHIAGTGVLPEHVRKPGDVLAVYQLARELGLDVMACARSVYFVKGKLIMSADLMAAIVLARGCKLSYPTYTHTEVTCRLVRDGQPTEVTWTIDDAKRAGLAGGDNWRKYPRAMLKARALSEACRLACPDMLAGAYVEGEIEETTITVHPEPEPQRAEPAAVTRARGQWTKVEQRRFFAKLAEIEDAPDYEDLANYLEAHGAERPSAVTEEARGKILAWLRDGPGCGKVSAWIAEWVAAEQGAEPEPEDAEVVSDEPETPPEDIPGGDA